jgi:hypothetical protein
VLPLAKVAIGNIKCVSIESMWIQGKRREPLRGRASYLNTYRRPEYFCAEASKKHRRLGTLRAVQRNERKAFVFAFRAIQMDQVKEALCAYPSDPQ